jgi:Sec-independent protein secretion pathway component TatC
LTVLFAVGLVFELPIFLLALVRLDVLSTKQLRSNRRLGYFIVAVIAVLLPGSTRSRPPWRPSRW